MQAVIYVNGRKYEFVKSIIAFKLVIFGLLCAKKVGIEEIKFIDYLDMWDISLYTY